MGLLRASFLIVLAFTLTFAIPSPQQLPIIKFIFNNLDENVHTPAQHEHDTQPIGVNHALWDSVKIGDKNIVIGSNQQATETLPEKESSRTYEITLETQDRQSSGLTFDRCQTENDCKGSRTCFDLTFDSLCSSDDVVCLCFKAQLCSSDEDCDEGERCFRVEDLPGASGAPGQICGSRAFVEAAGLDPPCIATHSIRHIPKDHLVFENDILANVLCDSNDSCATAGHMVLYKGKAIMMKSYCKLTGCVKKIMKVNSPRYRRGVTVPSRSKDLEFTLFAARYETRAEEGFLSMAVKVGL